MLNMLTCKKKAGGFISTYVFFPPTFRTGYIIAISFCCLSAAACIAYAVSLWHANRQRERSATVSNPDSLMSAQEEEDEEILGDMAPGYRYIY
jgi:hypothetical protein